MKKIALIFALIMSLSVVAASCNKDGEKNDETTENVSSMAEQMDLFHIDVSEYLLLGEYSGMNITLSKGESKGDALWNKVIGNAEIKKYPQQQIDYYFSQEKAKYEYLAKKGNDTYENILAGLGITEDDMLAEAKALTREDLVFAAVVKAENISLSDSDKQNNFDKYVDKYVDDYGYGEEYVRENMTEQIYESMLFDKMLEKLITLNTFTVTEG